MRKDQSAAGESRLPPDFVVTNELKQTIALVEESGAPVFITGKAGSGKSTFIDYLREKSKKNIVFLAPTGVAALNIRGKTIHSLFQFPPKIITKDEIAPVKYRGETRELFAGLETMVIDEISMARADIIDGIDYVLKKYRADPRPFGGVQMVFVGDLYQLPPVITDREKVTVTFNGKLHYSGTLEGYFKKIYPGQYFFDSRAFRNAAFQRVEFKTIFRQKGDMAFIHILNSIRENTVDSEILSQLNQRFMEGFTPDKNEARVTLCTTNAKANEINDRRLSELETTMFSYDAEISGEFDDNGKEYPAEKKLYLKVNSLVMLIKNDREHRWVNGSMGIIKSLKRNEIIVQIEGKNFPIEQEIWEAVEYAYDEETKRVVTRVTGAFRQYPLKLAWAITIHKSQGKTFDKVIIDLERGAFAHGQTYVALSRCRTLDGIILNRPIARQDIILDPRVTGFFQGCGDSCLAPTRRT